MQMLSITGIDKNLWNKDSYILDFHVHDPLYNPLLRGKLQYKEHCKLTLSSVI